MNFTKLDNGMYDGFALLKKVEKKTSVKGTGYMDIVLADKTDEISAKKWDVIEGLQVDTIVKVRGDLEIYNGKNQFKIAQIRHVIPGDNVNMEDFIPCSPYGGEVMFKSIRRLVEDFDDQDFKKIVIECLDKNREKLIFYPAAYRLHHAFRGGLLFHISSILEMAKSVAKIYTNVDKELLFSGVILHDIAKTVELDANETGISKGYTVLGNLIGHLVRGAIDIEIIANETGADKEKATLLQHMVISHHGEPEYGAAVRPMFLEAEILSQLDKLDATIFEINSATDKVEVGAFTDRQWALDNRKLFNHGRKTTKHQVELGD